VLEALPARWRLGPPTCDHDRRRWLVTAIGPHTGLGKLPQTVTGEGEDEIAALVDLDNQLRGVPRPDGGRMEELRRRVRLAYLDGAESWSRAEQGRGLDPEVLGRVIERYPGDP
jgi:hypothetical protein